MKKILALILAVMMMLGCVNAFAEETPLVGGWDMEMLTEIPDDALLSFNAALEDWVGVAYDPVALLGSQVVNGVNYIFLCKATVIYPGATPDWAFVTIHVDWQGNAEIQDITMRYQYSAEDEDEYEVYEEEAEATADLTWEASCEYDQSEDLTVVTVRVACQEIEDAFWYYSISDPSALEDVTGEYYTDEQTPGMIWAAVSYKAVGLENGEVTPGDTAINFWYATDTVESGRLYELTVKVTVNEDGTLTVTDCSFDE